jgi:predicted signal transduction protein with EAL and GGDEF domain
MVAEGIETAAQADWFRTLGCRYGQGFHFARPLPAAEVERFLRRRRAASRRGASVPSLAGEAASSDPAGTERAALSA